MLVKVLCLAFSSASGKFDDTELRDFMKDAEILSMRDYLFMRNEIPYLALIFKYFPTRQELDPKLAPQGKREEEWRQSLTEADMGLFNLLRDWRSKRCRKEGFLSKHGESAFGGSKKPQGLLALFAPEHEPIDAFLNEHKHVSKVIFVTPTKQMSQSDLDFFGVLKKRYQAFGIEVTHDHRAPERTRGGPEIEI